MSPKIWTFFSYKGGVGRSFCLADAGSRLARWGYRVLLVDWDLEAPGLHHYFAPYGAIDRLGLVELLFRESFSPSSVVQNVRIGDTVSLDIVTSGGVLPGLPTVQTLSWSEHYENFGLNERLIKVRSWMLEDYDFVLIDSRTGVSDIAGITSVVMPDAVACVVGPTEQSINGTAKTISAMREARAASSHDLGATPYLPILSRFESREEYQQSAEWRERAISKLSPFTTSWAPRSQPFAELAPFLSVPSVPFWSFGERIPALSDENDLSPDTVSYFLTNIAATIANQLEDVALLGGSRDRFIEMARAKAPVKLLRTVRGASSGLDSMSGAWKATSSERQVMNQFAVRLNRLLGDEAYSEEIVERAEMSAFYSAVMSRQSPIWLVGPSGSGRTTVLSVVESRTRGEVIFLRVRPTLEGSSRWGVLRSIVLSAIEQSDSSDLRESMSTSQQLNELLVSADADDETNPVWSDADFIALLHEVTTILTKSQASADSVCLVLDDLEPVLPSFRREITSLLGLASRDVERLSVVLVATPEDYVNSSGRLSTIVTLEGRWSGIDSPIVDRVVDSLLHRLAFKAPFDVDVLSRSFPTQLFGDNISAALRMLPALVRDQASSLLEPVSSLADTRRQLGSAARRLIILGPRSRSFQLPDLVESAQKTRGGLTQLLYWESLVGDASRSAVTLSRSERAIGQRDVWPYDSAILVSNESRPSVSDTGELLARHILVSCEYLAISARRSGLRDLPIQDSPWTDWTDFDKLELAGEYLLRYANSRSQSQADYADPQRLALRRYYSLCAQSLLAFGSSMDLPSEPMHWARLSERLLSLTF